MIQKAAAVSVLLIWYSEKVFQEMEDLATATNVEFNLQQKLSFLFFSYLAPFHIIIQKK